MTEWIKVKRAGELRPGLTIEIRPCGFCGRTERQVLLRTVVTEHPVMLVGLGDFAAFDGSAWTTAPGLCMHPRRPVVLSEAIASGRLWRLGDEDADIGATEGRTLERMR